MKYVFNHYKINLVKKEKLICAHLFFKLKMIIKKNKIKLHRNLRKEKKM